MAKQRSSAGKRDREFRTREREKMKREKAESKRQRREAIKNAPTQLTPDAGPDTDVDAPRVDDEADSSAPAKDSESLRIADDGTQGRNELPMTEA